MAMNRLMARVEADTNGGCWLWSGTTDADGYGRIMVHSVPRLAHRVSYELHTGDDATGLCVCHRCDIRACVNPDHLFLGTRGDNNTDRAAKGRTVATHGSRHPMSKLTEASVRKILASLSGGESQSALARRYNVNQSVISEINTGRSWPHIERN